MSVLEDAHEDLQIASDAIEGWSMYFNGLSDEEDKGLLDAIRENFKKLPYMPYNAVLSNVIAYQKVNKKYFSSSQVEGYAVNILTNEIKKRSAEKKIKKYE